ncbi:MAG: VCBS repeat-containing protein [Deltaproteobacteria bacterium]|nr:VCBS repeat-containing protein [Deltaproteobacteria bacterium]
MHRPPKSSVARTCERALVGALRATTDLARADARFAARRFVKRHRRDPGFLRWCTQQLARSAALAAALVGLGGATAPVAAAGPLGYFETLSGSANPLDGIDAGTLVSPTFADFGGDGDLDLVVGSAVGEILVYTNTSSSSTPSFFATPFLFTFPGLVAPTPVAVDLDRDGDPDLIAGDASGALHLLENIGHAQFTSFIRQTGAANPWHGVALGSQSRPSLGDLDADGDLDLVAGTDAGALFYFENTGSAVAPAFIARVGAQNPFASLASAPGAAPSLVDVDEDTDLDLVIGVADGTLLFFENTGGPRTPSLTPRTGAANPFDGRDVGSSAAPTFADVDEDGDPDLVAGTDLGTFAWIRNHSLTLIPRTSTANPLAAFSVPGYSKPALADLDADGDPDLLVGAADGSIAYLQNTGSRANPAFVQRTGAANPLAGFDAGNNATPTAADLDGDGDLDVVCGESLGRFVYFANTGTPSSPAFVQRLGTTNPLDGRDAGDRSTPTLGDLDADGDLDLVSGSQLEGFAYFENTGTAASPAFFRRTGAANLLDGQTSGYDSVPDLVDFDGDGDLDLASGQGEGSAFAYRENRGNPGSPLFALLPDGEPPFSFPIPDQGAYSAPALADLDGDGDVDLVSGEESGGLRFYENGSAVLRTTAVPASADPLRDADPGQLSVPTLGDLDADGDLDLIVGDELGRLFFHENTGLPTLPRFVARTGSANPFEGEDVGYWAAPVLADLDADGDLDLLVGSYDGAFSYYANTGSAVTPAFVLRTGASNPLSGIDLGIGAAPALGDLDRDGDLDLLAGDSTSDVAYFENTGTSRLPAFVERVGAANPLPGFIGTYKHAPAFADADRDGDLDVVLGADLGFFFWLENTRRVPAPFVLRLGAPNPLNGVDVGRWSTPAFADLDRDGDLDVVAGEYDGTVQTYLVPEPTFAGLLAAGLGWLGVIGRGRGQGRSGRG